MENDADADSTLLGGIAGENKRVSSGRTIAVLAAASLFQHPNCRPGMPQMYRLALMSIGLCVKSQWLIRCRTDPSWHGGHLFDCGPLKKEKKKKKRKKKKRKYDQAA